jgi:hypothetical protein
MHLPEIEIPHHETSKASNARRRSIVDRIVSGSAMFVALSSLAIALYEVRMMREHDRISVWPYVTAFNSDSGGIYTFNVSNAGIGPAVIESFEIHVDGKPRKNWGEVIDALGIDIGGTPSSYSSFGKGTVLLPGARSALLSIGPGLGGAAFHRASQPRMHPRICYCSLYEQCWLLDETQDSRPQPVKACAEPATPFTQ